MRTLIESPTSPLSLRDVSKISQSLAEDMQALVFRREGFTVEDYFSLDGNYLVEYVDGCLQILPMPDVIHQALVAILLEMLRAQLRADPGGRVMFAPFKVMLDSRHYREPDLCVMLGRHASRRHRTHWERADFVIEIVSESNRRHDLETKRHEYALAGIPEYWIVDPELRTISQFTLEAGAYAEPIIARGDKTDFVQSAVLSGFSVDVRQLFLDAEAEAK